VTVTEIESPISIVASTSVVVMIVCTSDSPNTALTSPEFGRSIPFSGFGALAKTSSGVGAGVGDWLIVGLAVPEELGVATGVTEGEVVGLGVADLVATGTGIEVAEAFGVADLDGLAEATGVGAWLPEPPLFGLLGVLERQMA
jgi:hypothetical protein